MRKLESVIAQFVEGLLQTIGDATVDAPGAFCRAGRRARLRSMALHSSPTLFAPSSRGVPAARGAGRERARSRGRAAEAVRMHGPRSHRGLPLPPGVAEITDSREPALAGRAQRRLGVERNGLLAPNERFGWSASSGRRVALARRAGPSSFPRTRASPPRGCRGARARHTHRRASGTRRREPRQWRSARRERLDG